MAALKAAASPTGTSAPSRPPSRISVGPPQSVDTTGIPDASASTTTLLKLSLVDASAKQRAPAYSSHGSAT